MATTNLHGAIMPEVFFNNSMRPSPAPEYFDSDILRKARAFHQSIEPRPTPLLSLPRMAEFLGLGEILVKDESRRFGLDSFKALGASWAVARELAKQPGGRTVLVAATDGNHGRALAWAAKRHGLNAIIRMPKGSSQSRVEAIRQLGAECFVTEANYDDTVQALAEEAEAKGWTIIQDTAWPGYVEIPKKIMQGYATIVLEYFEQTASPPDHVFLQAGVGSFAASIIAAFLAKGHKPRFIIVEPRNAACLFLSLNKGVPGKVEGSLSTIMAGLSCGRPNPLAWPIIRDHAFCAMACPDFIAANGMRMFGAPLPGDIRIVSGESGAAGMGALAWLTLSPNAGQYREKIQLDKNSRTLLINTEGATNPQLYRQIVWFGNCYSIDKHL